MRRSSRVFFALAIAAASATAFGQVQIPKAAWSRPLGQPLENPGHLKPALKSSLIDDGYWQGAPVGGFGAGTFSRTYRGDFARWHIKAGIHKYQTVLVDQFSVYQRAEGDPQGYATVLYAGKPEGMTEDAPLSGWNWDYPVGAGKYYSLYPKSWYEYRSPKLPVNLTVEQFSPILPNNYKETSYPVAIYNWHAENPTNKAVTVSVMFSWQNMVGWFRDYGPKFDSVLNEQNTNRFIQDGAMKGIVFDRIRDGNVVDEWDGQFAIATMQHPGVEVSYLTTWTPESPLAPGNDVWGSFSRTGKLPNISANYSSSGEPISGAIAVTFTLQAGERRTIPIVLAWDLPVVQFGGGRKWYRKYTDYFGKSGTNAWAIAKTGLQNADTWSKAIDDWQRPYITDESKPLWYRGMLFNELYALADLGSVWAKPTAGPPNNPLTQRETFSWLECFDYPYYETLDVRFYGSMPLTLFWPELEKNVMRAFSDTVPQEDPTRYIWQWKMQQEKRPEWRTRKTKGSVPHDLGVPKEDPFFRVNQFSWQNTVRWKDLNSKFVLMVWRDYVYSGKKDRAFLEYTWPSIKLALDYMKQFDLDGSGLPDGEGFPDQTYDTWRVHGDSAYSGGLYLAALRAGEEVAKLLGDSAKAQEYRALFTKGQKSYVDKLWTGEYFRYDVGSSYRENIQADQLAGQWYADLTGLGDLVSPEMKKSSLRKIYEFNVKRFHNGERGAVNGMSPAGELLTENEQIEEVWTGTTLGVAAHMKASGLTAEAYGTAWGVYHTTYETHGYWFRTPEAWNEAGEFRASMYMRPGAIWAMEMKPEASPSAKK